jgi:hypothetical protein
MTIQLPKLVIRVSVKQEYKFIGNYKTETTGRLI